MLTATAQLGIRAMLVIGKEATDGPISPVQIAEALTCSRSYLQKVLHDLTRAKLVKATRGKNGGVELLVPSDQITLRQIVESTQGLFLPDYCQPVKLSSVRVCAFHRAMAEVHHGVTSILERWTLAHLLAECAPVGSVDLVMGCRIHYCREPFLTTTVSNLPASKENSYEQHHHTRP